MADGQAPSKLVDAPAIPRRFLLWNAVGVCAGLAFGLALYIGHGSGFGLFIVAWVLLGAPTSLWLGV
jgi:hypothetical protein